MFEFHLDEDIFEVVKNSTKRVEVRLYDEKRRKMKIGDELIFLKRPLMNERINTKIVGLKVYNNFQELVSNYDISELYFSSFSKEEQEKYGVVAIEFEVM